MDVPPLEGVVIRHVIHGQGRLRVRLLPAADGLVRTMDVRIDENQQTEQTGSDHHEGQILSDQDQIEHGQGYVGLMEGHRQQVQTNVIQGIQGQEYSPHEDDEITTSVDSEDSGQFQPKNIQFPDECTHARSKNISNKSRGCQHGNSHRGCIHWGNNNRRKTVDTFQGQQGGETSSKCQTEHDINQNIITLDTCQKERQGEGILTKPDKDILPSTMSEIDELSQENVPQTNCERSNNKADVKTDIQRPTFLSDNEESNYGEGKTGETISGISEDPLQITRLLAGEFIPQGSVIWEFCPTTERLDAQERKVDRTDISAEILTSKDATISETSNGEDATVIAHVQNEGVGKRPDIKPVLETMVKCSNTKVQATIEMVNAIADLRDSTGDNECENKAPTGVESQKSGLSKSEESLKEGRQTVVQHAHNTNDPLKEASTKCGLTVLCMGNDKKDNVSSKSGNQDFEVSTDNERSMHGQDDIQDGDEVTSSRDFSACWEQCSALERAGLAAMYENPEGPGAFILLLYILVSAYQSASLPNHYVILNNHLRFARYSEMGNVSVKTSETKLRLSSDNEKTLTIDQVVALRDISKGEEILRNFQLINEMENIAESF